MNNMQKKSHCFIQYLYVICLILECHSVYSQIYGYHLIIRGIITIISILCMIIILLNRKVKIYKSVLSFIIFELLSSALIFTNTDNNTGKMIIILIFMFFLPLTLIFYSNLSKSEFKQLLNKFVNVVVVLSLISLIIWFLSSIIPIFKPNGSLKVVWGHPYSIFESIYYIHFNYQVVYWITGNPIMRNTGIFTEGPMYAVILIIALIFNDLIYYDNSRKSLKKTLIIFVTLISTMSTTGLVCAILIMLFNLKNYISILPKSIKPLLICLIGFAILVSVPIGYNLLDKKMSTGSAIHRNMDLKNGLNAFLNNPIIGNGISHQRGTEEDYEVGYGYSNTIIPVITDGGILLGIIYLLPMILLGIKSIIKKNYNNLMLLIIYMIILLTTLIQYRLITMTLISIIFILQYENNLFINNKQKY